MADRMVFKIVRAGRKVRALHHGLKSDKHLKKYHAEMLKRSDLHPLSEDIEIMQRDVDWLRFSEAGIAYLKSLVPKKNAPEPSPESKEPDRSPPFATILDVFMEPVRWSGESVIIDGELELMRKKGNGEHWHIFTDESGMVTAVSDKELVEGHGTLFGVARQTITGKQVFLEVKNFHPRQ